MTHAALILGHANSLFDDIADLEALIGGPWPGIVIAVNRAAIDYKGRVDHWVSLHAGHFPEWQAERGPRNDSPVTWTRLGHPVDSEHYGIAEREAPHWRGSSGLLAVSVAEVLGIPKRVLAGVRIDLSPHWGEFRPWTGAKTHQRDWIAKKKLLRQSVRSMSGWTAGLLGKPTREWIMEEA